MTSRELQAQATKQKVLESAKRLIGAKGYDNVTIDAIVADCGVAKGTFYHYFKSKEDITVYLCSIIYDELEKQLVELEHMPLAESLSRFITSWYIDVNTYNLHFARQSLRLYIQSAEQGDRGVVISHMEHGIELIGRLLHAAIDNGELLPETPVDVLSKAIMFSMQGSTVYHCKYEDQFDVMDWCSDFISLIVTPLLDQYLK